MPLITADSLMTLEAYSKARKDFRAEVIAHKKNRMIHLGKHITLQFEDELTMRYQIQEMLRIERVFEANGIQDELDAYNPLIPDGHNWKATMFLEYEDVEMRKKMLAKLIDIEDGVWVRVAGFDRVYAIADEDLERERPDKTSSVHFLRFDFTAEMIFALKHDSDVAMGIDHPAYEIEIMEIDPVTRQSLLADLT